MFWGIRPPKPRRPPPRRGSIEVLICAIAAAQNRHRLPLAKMRMGMTGARGRALAQFGWPSCRVARLVLKIAMGLLSRHTVAHVSHRQHFGSGQFGGQGLRRCSALLGEAPKLFRLSARHAMAPHLVQLPFQPN